jgi:hypothetical protein
VSPKGDPIWRKRAWWIVPALCTVWFLSAVWHFHDSRTGFSSLIVFGERTKARLIPAVRDLPLFFHEGGGYDGQFYAQIATDPLLHDPDLDRALDLAPHRARRILFSWTAYVAGFGKPARILAVYALQNVVCWLILGWLAFRWLPPTSGRNVALWFATMFAGGLLWSVRDALLDGPSLLLMAFGVLALERGRPWVSAVIFGVSGLGRETNILSAAAQWQFRWNWKAIVQQILQVALIALPLLIWFDYLYSLYRGTLFTTGRVMAGPLEWYLWRWRAVWPDILTDAWHAGSRFSFLILVSMSVQALFLFAWPRWKDPWWRLGFAYAVLMIFFGRPLWESDPGGLRVVLPMTMAFNVLLVQVHRPWLFWPLVVMGNLSVLYGLHLMQFPGTRAWL